MEEIEFVIYAANLPEGHPEIKVKFVGRNGEGHNIYQNVLDEDDHYIEDDNGNFYRLDYKFRPEKGQVSVQVAATRDLETIFSRLSL